MDNTIETMICGNEVCGLSQSTCGNTLQMYAGGIKVFTVSSSMITLNTRASRSMGLDVASTGNITLGSDGGLFHITGTNTIDFINTIGWPNGSDISLIFTDIINVTHNASSPPSGYAPFKLAGGLDFTGVADSTLSLTYDGTAWYEMSRKA